MPRHDDVQKDRFHRQQENRNPSRNGPSVKHANGQSHDSILPRKASRRLVKARCAKADI
jgi:hypothetical protein